MTTVTELSLSTEDVALADTFERLPDLEVRVKSVVAEGPLQTMPLVWFSNESRETLDEVLEADSSVEEFICLLEDPGVQEWLYRIEYDSGISELSTAIFENDGTILDAQCSSSHWTIRLLFPNRNLLSKTMSELEDRGLRADVRRMVEAGRDSNLETRTGLTDAQREAISEAYRQGYYEVPRGISLENLADELDISHQALSERLRRANKVLASEQLDGRPGQVAIE